MFSHSTANYLTQVLPFPYVFKLSLSFYISLCSHKSVDYWWCQYVLSPLSLRTQLGNTLNTCNKLDPLSNWERSTWLQQLQCNCTFLFCTICTIWHQVAHCLLVAALSQKRPLFSFSQSNLATQNIFYHRAKLTIITVLLINSKHRHHHCTKLNHISCLFPFKLKRCISTVLWSSSSSLGHRTRWLFARDNVKVSVQALATGFWFISWLSNFLLLFSPVCIGVLNKLSSKLSTEEKANPELIEQRFRELCLETKKAENRFVSVYSCKTVTK